MPSALCVYILASRSRRLYTGVTKDLQRRLLQHRSGLGPGAYTARHGIHRLVYFEVIRPPSAAIARERQIKGWTRQKRIALIEAWNPEWRDLAPE